MMESQKPYRWRIRVLSVGSCVFGITTALFPVAIFRIFYAHPPLLLTLLLYGLAAVFMTLGWWWFFERPNAADKIPTSSKELRRRKKEFYEWLDSQGRR